jgi:hypothetical protein
MALLAVLSLYAPHQAMSPVSPLRKGQGIYLQEDCCGNVPD